MKSQGIVTAGVLAFAAIVLSQRKGEEGDPEETETAAPAIGKGGFAPSRTDLLPFADPAAIEASIMARGPVEMDEWLDEGEARCGHFHIHRRGELLIGEGPKSVAWNALYEAAVEAATLYGDDLEHTQIHAFARRTASNVNKRIQLANLITSSTFNDLMFGTWGYSGRDFCGPHGRGLCLDGVHYDVLQALRDGDQPQRSIDICLPQHAKTGMAKRRARKDHPDARCRPLYWIPQINLRLLYEEGQITTRHMVWEDCPEVSMQEPPAAVLRLLGVPV